MRLTTFGKLLTVVLSTWFAGTAFAAEPAAKKQAPKAEPAKVEEEAKPDQIRLGLFITNIYNIDFANNQFSSQFWAWFNHDRESFTAQSGIEFPSAKNSRILNTVKEERDGKIWAQAKYDVQFNQYWDIRNYPFDRQVLTYVLECADADSSGVQFVADQGSKLSDELTLDGWDISNFRVKNVDHEYNTSYGDPDLGADGPSAYSRVIAELELKRNGWRLLFYNFLGFVFGISLSGVVLYVNAVPRLSETIVLATKVAMGTGALFASVGAAYVLQARLPSTTAFTVADAIQGTAFLATLLAVISSLAAEALTKAKRTEAATLMGRILFASFLLMLAVDAYLLTMAVKS